MKTNALSARETVERIILALTFTAVGAFIMIIFDPWRGEPLLGRVEDYLGKLIAAGLLLGSALLARRSPRYEKYWQVLFGLFILCFAVSLDWIFGIYLMGYLGVNDKVPAGWALPKLNDFLVIVSVVVVFTRISGGSLGSIYLQKGKLKLGLTIGGIAFLVAAAGAIPTAELLFKADGLTLNQVIPWLPWMLVFVLANASMEEILFRGLFLRKLEPFFGKFISNCLIALVFTVLHKGAAYTSNEYIFLAILVPSALVWGYIMQKTDSAWGSILFHAGMDLPVILGILANL